MAREENEMKDGQTSEDEDINNAPVKKKTSIIASVSKLFAKKEKKNRTDLEEAASKNRILHKIEEKGDDDDEKCNTSDKKLFGTPSAILGLLTQDKHNVKPDNVETETEKDSPPTTVGWSTLASYFTWGGGQRSEVLMEEQPGNLTSPISNKPNPTKEIPEKNDSNPVSPSNRDSNEEPPSYFRMATWVNVFYSATKKSGDDNLPVAIETSSPAQKQRRKSSLSFSDTNIKKFERPRTKSKVLDQLGIETEVQQIKLPTLHRIALSKASLAKKSEKSGSFISLDSRDELVTQRGDDFETGKFRGRTRRPRDVKDSGTNMKLYVAITVCSCICVGGLTFLLMTLFMGNELTSPISTTNTDATSLRQFLSSLQVQEVDDEMADWSSDLKELKSPRAQKIIDALKPRIRSAFESEGFSTDDVIITKIGPISVTIYHVMNNTVTSLSSGDEISLASTFELAKGQTMPEKDKPKPQGHRLIIRVEFETAGKPSDNAQLIDQVGEAEVGKIQFMLGKYLENQGVVAKAESLEVSQEYQDMIKAQEGRNVQPTPNTNQESELNIDCYKTGKSLGMSRAVVGCPAKCNKVKKPTLIGTDSYMIDSMICLAAIHSYVIKAEDGGSVEFLKSGEGFLFAGAVRNKIKSETMLRYEEKFIVKKPGPSWTTVKQPTTTTMPTTEGLQETTRLLLTGQMTALSIDKSPISFSLSLSYSTKLSSEMRSLLSNKLMYAMEEMKFSIDKMEVYGFEPDMTSSSALRLSFKAFGGYKANSEALFPYKPWDSEMISTFILKLKILLNDEGLQLTGLTVAIDEDYHAELSVMQSTTTATPTEPSTSCTCAEVFFLLSAMNLRSKTEVDSIIGMFETLFDTADFDQFRLKIGIAVVVPADSEQGQQSKNYVLITDVGNKETNQIIADLTFELISIVESRDPGGETDEKEELWKTLEELKKYKFFTDDFETRSKLLVVTSQNIVGSDVNKDLEQYESLKKKGMKILYTGYDWTDREGYPDKYVSSPEIDFVKSVRSIGEIEELATYVFDVMRKYICSEPQGICAIRTLKEDEDVDVEVTVTEPEGSYARGVPEGTGLKLYKVKGGLTFENEVLAKTDSVRRTEPDLDQAYYMKYECGKQSIQPNVTTKKEAKIVGGSEAVPNSWPWIISINKVRSKYDSLTNKLKYTHNSWFCAGTIVAPSWVVTASHCFADGEEKKYTTNYKIVTGLHNQKTLPDLEGNVYDIRRIIYHPYYNDAKNKYDIALLQTHLPIKFSQKVLPACLPNPDVIPSNGKGCALAGWGYTNTKGDADRHILKQATQIVEDPNKCQTVYKGIQYDPNINFCVERSKTDSSDMQCRGDSGGPLVCLENRKWVLYGVANWGFKDCEKKGEGAYALVPTMMDWMCCYITTKIGPCVYTKCNTKLT